MFDIIRRDFVTLLCGTAATLPLTARAQQPGQVRRVGVLMGLAQNDPEAQLRAKALEAGLRELGWVEGRNVRLSDPMTTDMSVITSRKNARV
jgi:putative tryptophan/tyrosine transport system substrate-binding protein